MSKQWGPPQTADEGYREAQNRIRNLQGDALDLAHLKLKRLPKELYSISSLKKLDLTGSRITDTSILEKLTQLESLSLAQMQLRSFALLNKLTGLRKLNLYSTNIRTLDDLANLVELRFLDLGGTSQIETLAPISKIRQLEELYLSARGVTDISPLEGLDSLRVLDLGGSGIADLSPLRKMLKLEVLDLNDFDGPLTEISPLKRLTRLTYLNLYGHKQLRDISPLQSLTELKNLNLGYCPITDLSPLSSLTKLAVLDLANTRVSDLSPLRVRHLNELRLGSNRVVDYSFLGGVPELRKLMPAGSNLDLEDGRKRLPFDLSAIGQLACLEELEIYKPVASFSFFESCHRLKALSIFGQIFTDVNSFRNLSELEVLTLSGCPNLTDLSGLSSLQKLVKLNLNRCGGIADISPIAEISHLKDMKITDAKFTDASMLGRLHSLERLELTHCRQVSRLGSFRELKCLRELVIESGEFSDISGLANLPELERLVLADCEQITDISVVATLPKIQTLCFNASTNIKRIRPLEAVIGQLKYLELDGCMFADAPDLFVEFEADNVGAVRKYFESHPLPGNNPPPEKGR